MIRSTILLIAVGLAAAGCAVTEGRSAPGSRPPTAEDDQAVRATVDHYWRAWVVAGDPPDPEHPDLLSVTTGEARQQEAENLRAKRAAGQVRRLSGSGVFRHDTRSVAVSGDTAVVTECVLDDVVVYEVASGRIVNGDVATVLMEQHLVRWSRSWRVESSVVKASRPGNGTCDGLS